MGLNIGELFKLRELELVLAIGNCTLLILLQLDMTLAGLFIMSWSTDFPASSLSKDDMLSEIYYINILIFLLYLYYIFYYNIKNINITKYLIIFTFYYLL